MYNFCNGPARRLVRSGCGSRYAGGSACVLPRTRRRRICDSRNPSSPSVTAGQLLWVEVNGSCTREDGLDRTRPSPGSAAVGFGGGVWGGPKGRPPHRKEVRTR